MEHIVFYHANCMDGTSAAAGVWLSLDYNKSNPQESVVRDDLANYHSINYDDCRSVEGFMEKYEDKLSPNAAHPKNDTHIMFVDFYPGKDICEKLLYHGYTLTVIDHHATTMDSIFDVAKNWNNFGYVMSMDNKLSGGALVCSLRHSLESINDSNRNLILDEPKEMFLKDWKVQTNLDIKQLGDLHPLYELIRVRDIWDESDPDMKRDADFLNSGLSYNHLYNLDGYINTLILSEDINIVATKIMSEGRLIHSVHESMVKASIKTGFKDTIITNSGDEVKLLICFVPNKLGSLLGDMWKKENEPDKKCISIGMTWVPDKNLIGLTLRSSNNISCRVLAENLGGGGHDCASGASIDNVSELNLSQLVNKLVTKVKQLY